MNKILKRTLIGVAIAIPSLILIVVGIAAIMWHNEISGLMSIEKIVEKDEENRSGAIYEIEMSGGYYFDEFIEKGGAANDQELIDHIVDNLTKGVIPISFKAPTIGCSSFTCKDSDGVRYFGRNYDFSTTTGIIVKCNPGDGRHASISSADLQFLGIKNGRDLNGLMDNILCLAAPYVPLDGINDAGVACGIYMSYQGKDENGRVVSTNQQTDKPDLTSTTMLRMILDYADSVDEAVELVSKYDLHDSASTSFHYMVADSTGKSAILEWVYSNDVNDNDGSKRELKVYYNDQDSMIGEKEGRNNFQYVTNFLVTPDYYTTTNKGGLDRYNEIEKMINPDGSNTEGLITKDYALEVLKTVGRRRWDPLHGKTDSNSITCWSALYDLTNLSVTWISNEQFDNPLTFDFSFTK